MPVFFFIALILIIWIRYEGNRHAQSQEMSSEEFWRREREASFTRKADISGLPYVKVPDSLFDGLPVLKEPRYNESLERLKALAGTEMLNLTGITNTELKSRYGVGNFTFLSECNERYDEFYVAVKSIITVLKESGYEAEALDLQSFLADVDSVRA